MTEEARRRLVELQTYLQEATARAHEAATPYDHRSRPAVMAGFLASVCERAASEIDLVLKIDERARSDDDSGN